MAVSSLETVSAVSPRPAMRAGFRSTWTSRSMPPIRSTLETPLTDSSALARSLSTNHDRSCSSSVVELAVYVSSAELAASLFETVGAAISLGRLARAPSTALRTSLSAVCGSFSSLKLTLMLTAPSVILVVMWSSCDSEVSLSSILRATSFSSCEGAAPSSEAEMLMVGRSMSGKSWTCSL